MTPAAIRVFARERAVLRLARTALGTDHILRLDRADLSLAVRRLTAEVLPAVVVVDVDGVSDPLSPVDELLALCAFSAHVLVLGGDDPDLVRELLRRGVADYLVKPVGAAALRGAVEAVLSPDEAVRPHAGSVVALAGSVGAGLSTLVASLAHAATATGRTGVVVDLDPRGGMVAHRLGARSSGDLAALLDGLGGAGAGAADAARSSYGSGSESDCREGPSEAELDAVCAPAGTSLALCAYRTGTGAPPATPAAGAVERLLSGFANRAHVVWVLGLCEPALCVDTLRWADGAVVLYEPTLPSVGASVHLLGRLGSESIPVLVESRVRMRMRRNRIPVSQIRYAFADRVPDVRLPFDRTLHVHGTAEMRDVVPSKSYRSAVDDVLRRVLEA